MNNPDKPSMEITLTDTKPSIFESKVGGMGYIPHDKDFPTDSNGKQLRLLAQIDCSEIYLEEFPEKGLLQFWILCDDLYGWDFDNKTNQEGFRVIYYPEVDTTVTEEEIKSKFVHNETDGDEYLTPVSKEYGMTFEKSEDSYVDKEAIDSEDEEGWEEWENLSGHKIGGYPYFTQYDQRIEEEKEKYDFLLFQLDTEWHDNIKVVWGDMGVGNFFINSEKLKNLDFSDVLYHWDCT